jgi:hypothetical protein
LPIPDKKENDPGNHAESEGDPNANTGVFLDPSMLGNTAINASMYGETATPALGEVVDEGVAGMKALTEEQVIGTDINISKLQKNGVTREQEDKLDAIKAIPDLHRRQVEENLESKRALSTSFDNRKELGRGLR